METDELKDFNLIELLNYLYEKNKDNMQLLNYVKTLTIKGFVRNYKNLSVTCEITRDLEQQGLFEMGSRIHAHCYGRGYDNNEKISEYLMKQFYVFILQKLLSLKRGDRIRFLGNEKYSPANGTFVWGIYQANDNYPSQVYVIEHAEGKKVDELLKNNPNAVENIQPLKLKNGLKYIIVLDATQLEHVCGLSRYNEFFVVNTLEEFEKVIISAPIYLHVICPNCKKGQDIVFYKAKEILTNNSCVFCTEPKEFHIDEDLEKQINDDQESESKEKQSNDTHNDVMGLVKELYYDLGWGETKEFLDDVNSKDAQSFAIQFHHGVGMQIRNAYGFWKRDTKLYRYFVSIGITEPDEMSHKVFLELYKYAKEQQLKK